MDNGLTRYKLGDLIEVTRGQSLAGEFYAEQGEYIRLTLANFDYQNGGFKEDKQKSDLFYTGPLREECILNEGDIITPLTEQTIGLLGSTARIPKSGIYVQSGDVALIKCNEELIDPSFCYYLLPSAQVKKQLAAGSQQTKIRHTSPDAIKSCVVDIPCLEEQKKIGRILDSLSFKISLNRSINNELETIAKDIYDYWFVQFDFPDANGLPYKSSGGKMHYSPVLNRLVPEGWETVRLKDRCETFLGGTPSTENQEYWGGSYPWLSSGEVAEFPVVTSEKTITQKGLDNSATSYLKAGSVTLSITRHLRPSILAIDACVNQSIVGVSENESFKHSYLYPLISRDIPRLMKLRTGAQQPHISKEVVDNIPFVEPPLEILQRYYENVTNLYANIFNNAKQIHELQIMRDKLLPLFMTGQVKIN